MTAAEAGMTSAGDADRPGTAAAADEGEHRYRVLADISPDATLVVADERIVFANQAAGRLLGAASAADLIGTSALDHVDAAVHERARERIRRTVAAGSKPWTGESRWRRVDGKVLDVELSAGRVEWEGRPAVQLVVRDTSDQRRADAALRESEQRYRLVVRATDDVIWDWSYATGRVIWSENMARVFGHDPATAGSTIEDAVAWWSSHIHPDDRERVVEDFQRSAAGSGDSWREEYRFRRGDGEYIEIVDVGYIGRAPDGAPTRMVGAMRDVTELVRARAEAEAASHAKSRFLSTLSHELRTPLNAVIGVADLLVGEMWGAVSGPQREQIQRIKVSAWHLVSIIDEILTFTRAEAGKEEVRTSQVDLTEIVRSVVDLMQSEAGLRGLSLVLAADTPATPVTTDAGKARQILVNLVGNALKYTEEGSVQVQVEPTADGVSVHVCDTGRGIPFERLDDIFEPFVQVDNSTTRTRGGTGLGLTICRKLARLLGGDVTVTSRLGRGSEFTLRVPREWRPAARDAATAG